MASHNLAVVCSKTEKMDGKDMFTALFALRGKPYAKVIIQANGVQSDLISLAKKCLFGQAPKDWEDGEHFSVRFL